MERTINLPSNPSCPHPLHEAKAVSEAACLTETLAITGYALRHAPDEAGTQNYAWWRSFDRCGGKIPPADWRTATLRRLHDFTPDNAA